MSISWRPRGKDRLRGQSSGRAAPCRCRRPRKQVCWTSSITCCSGGDDGALQKAAPGWHADVLHHRGGGGDPLSCGRLFAVQRIRTALGTAAAGSVAVGGGAKSGIRRPPWTLHTTGLYPTSTLLSGPLSQ